MTEEEKRIDALYSFEVLDSIPEIEFDNITFLASTLCNTPISTITLVDKYRQWFKSKIGLNHTESPRESSFCSLAIEKSSKTIVIERLMEDEDFKKIGLLNGLTNSGFYAGVPIKDRSTGYIIGTLCVIDYENKKLTEAQISSLEILAEQTSKLLELRKRYKSVSKINESLNLKYIELEQFASVVSHDIKSPINNIISLIHIIKRDSENIISEESFELINHIEEASMQLKYYIDGLLNYYRADTINLYDKEVISIRKIIEETKLMLNIDSNFNLKYTTDYEYINCNKYGLIQILLNLLSNGIKYNDKEIIELSVNFSEDSEYYCIKISDNGIGISKDKFDVIYDSFKILNIKDRFGKYGTGIGLSTVKKIVTNLNGKIEVQSILNEGSIFKIYLSK
ncbi:GAF domain-containing sensor histidine kinase [Flavobacterium sp. SUN052]|uniref:sensor histidine kinase n=1 Tax=Flavobacterium sp. SUN052 TaxID=3002441 RepID=UPI00237DA1F4|nr:GAF domain-containing sensor histidine kinase [Flavobacterium sp. SUN052]MEC4003608.1 GAF domain-containing sensor histidine kinase [Flavobacterium sp. SUN052]